MLVVSYGLSGCLGPGAREFSVQLPYDLLGEVVPRVGVDDRSVQRVLYLVRRGVGPGASRDLDDVVQPIRLGHRGDRVLDFFQERGRCPSLASIGFALDPLLLGSISVALDHLVVSEK